jgi:ribosome-binding factor A
VSEYRLKRIENLVRDHISGLIMQEEIKDPRIDSLLSVSRVKVSKDLGYADIYVSGFIGEKKIEKAVAALNHASGFIQHKLRGKLHMRKTPVLRFIKDDTIAEGFRMTQKLKELT